MHVTRPPLAVYQQAGLGYPHRPPFHPPLAYPELPPSPLDPENQTYAAVRELFRLMGMDRDGAGTPAWNPLGDVIRPGDRVVIKPNLVRESHLSRLDEWDYVITHGAVVRPIIDYVLIALRGSGHIVIADGPQTDSSFAAICERGGYAALIQYYRGRTPGVTVDLLDLREQEWTTRDGVVVARRVLAGDPLGYTSVDLGTHSAFVGFSGEGRYYGASFDVAETNRAHHGMRHAYVLSRTVQACDVLINVPKLKTHKKAGITCCLKNLVGINGNKNYLPHYTLGTPADGGDQYNDSSRKQALEGRMLVLFRSLVERSPQGVVELLRHAKKLGRAIFGDTRDVVRSGNWHGNDTIWRMILDLNRAMLYYDGDGQRRASPRRFFAVVDAILAGDGDGPLSPDPVALGTLLAGTDPVVVDRAAAALMGFDWKRIPSIANAFAPHALPLTTYSPDEVEARSNMRAFEGGIATWDTTHVRAFRPHFGWTGRVEQPRAAAEHRP